MSYPYRYDQGPFYAIALLAATRTAGYGRIQTDAGKSMTNHRVKLSLHTKTLIGIVVAVIVAVFALTSPIPQDPAYHHFSDQRTILRISNFWNVISNLPFLFVGIAGLSIVFRYADKVCVKEAAAAYVALFSGIVLTAFGSAYYHLAPSNEALVWDRMPMTIGIAGLFCVIVAEFMSPRVARRLLLLLLIVGFGSVEYWIWTESRGVGDLRPYGLFQFLPMLLIPVILLTHKPRIGEPQYFWWMLVFYGIAKLFEFLDAEVFALGSLISGHSLKHLAAAVALAVFVYALIKRR